MSVSSDLSKAATARPWLSVTVPSSFPKPINDGHTVVDGARLYHAQWGDGDPLLLLHSGLGSIESWSYQIEYLAKNYRVLALETRGHGRSTRDERPYSFEQLANDVIAVLDDVGIERVSVVGSSDGGNTAIHLARTHSHRIKRGMTIGANFHPSGLKPDVMESPVVQDYLRQATALHQTTSSTPNSFDQLAIDLSDLWSREPNLTSAVLGRIATTFTVAHATYDEAIQEDHSKDMATSLGNAVYVEFPDASHFAPLQTPDIVNIQIHAFMQR